MMTSNGTFDPIEFKEKQQAEWQTAAPGWRKWCDVIEAEAGNQVMTRKLVELAELEPGDAVLDVAAGYGEPGLAAARAVLPGGRVVCTDIAADMLAFGRERASRAGLDNVEFLECDAEALEFAPAEFDAVVSRTGLMFLPDVPGTLRRLHSFLKPRGRFAATVWGPPPTVQLATALPVVLRELELPPPAPGPGMFALADANILESHVSDAGFADVTTGTVTVAIETESAEQFALLMRDVSAPISELVETQPPEVQRRVWEKVADAYRAFETPDGRVRTENQAVWVVGTRA